MSSKKFNFGPQPALDKAIANLRNCEDALRQANIALAQEKEKLRLALAEIDRAVQRVKSAHENIVSTTRKFSAPGELAQANRNLDMLRAKELATREAAERQKERVAFAADRVELRKRELAEAMSEVQALEKLKEKRRLEHHAALLKAEEAKRDDEAIQLWNNRGD
jgi:hypothetical protein